MSGFIVVLAPGAENDIAEAFKWYRERSAPAAQSFKAEVFDAIDRIAAAPMARPADEDGHRNRVVRHFPFTVWYDVTEQTVRVLAVAHHRRRPGYWGKKS